MSHPSHRVVASRPVIEMLEGRRLLVGDGSVPGEPQDMLFPDTYTTAAPAPVGRFEGYSAIVGGKLYAMGGFDSNFDVVPNIDIYDPETNRWETIRTDIPAAGTHAGVAVDGSSIYFAGGYLGSLEPGRVQKITRAVWRYDTATNNWAQVAELPQPRGGGALVKVGRQLHYFGGCLSDRVTNSGAHWQFKLGKSSGGKDDATVWTRRPAMPAARDHFSAVSHNGLIYAIGGEYGHDVDHNHTKVVHSFNPANGKWRRLADMPAARSHQEAATFVYGGRIFVGGGQYGEYEPARDVFEYDIARNQWKRNEPLPAARQGGVMLKMGNRVVVTLGGEQTDVPKADTWLADFRLRG